MTIPDVFKFLKTTAYRDGGSIGFKFSSDNSGQHEYELFLKVDLKERHHSNNYIFECAILNHGYNCIYNCPMTGQEIPDYKIESRIIEWHEALLLFNIIDDLAKDLSSHDDILMVTARDFFRKRPTR